MGRNHRPEGSQRESQCCSYEVLAREVSLKMLYPLTAFQSIISRSLNVQDARKMLVDTLRWREEFKVEEATKAEYPKDVFGNLSHIYGKDKGGRPVW